MRKVLFKRLIFAFFLMLCAYDTFGQQAAHLPEGFVYPSGRTFRISDGAGGGNPYYFSGTNNYYLMYKPMNMVEDVLNDMLYLGQKAVRMWIFMDGRSHDGYVLQPEAGVYDEASMQHIDEIMVALQQRGLKAVPVFINYWSDFGGMAQYANWAGTSTTNFYSDPTCKQLFKDYMSMWANRVNTITGVAYKDDPTILSWQLTNEARATSQNLPDMLAWVREMSDYLRTQDANHMITLGDEGLMNLAYDDVSAINGTLTDYQINTNWPYTGSYGDWETVIQMPNISYGTIHNYATDNWGYDLDWGIAWTRYHIDIANKYNVPCVMEEYDKAYKGNWDTQADQERAVVLEAYQQIIRDYDMAGDMSWMLVGRNYFDPVEPGYTLDNTAPVDQIWLYRVKWPGDGHQYSRYDPYTGPALKNHCTLMNQKSGNTGPLKPIANAGEDLVVIDTDGDGSESLSLDASKSFDPDGTIVSYSWTLENEVIGTGATPLVTLPVGNHIITLSLTDNEGQVGTDILAVNVLKGGSRIFEAEAASLTGNTSVSADATANGGSLVKMSSAAATIAFDIDNVPATSANYPVTIFFRSWEANSSNGTRNNWVISSADGKKHDVAFAPSDNWTSIQLNLPLNAGSNTITIEANWGYMEFDYIAVEGILGDGTAANQLPIANAGEDQVVNDTDEIGSVAVTLDGSGSHDPDGSITEYLWVEDGIVIGTTVNPTVELAVGSHTIILTVTDNRGGTAADQVEITVNSGATANQPPVAVAGSDQTVVDFDNDGMATVTLDASSSIDTDGSISAFSWKLNDVEIATGPTASVELPLGIHLIQLTITDDQGAKATDQVEITVVENSGQPLASLIESFESYGTDAALASKWSSQNTGYLSVSLSEEHVTAGTQSMRMDYNIDQPIGVINWNIHENFDDDFNGKDGLAFSFVGDNSGRTLKIDIKEQSGEHWEASTLIRGKEEVFFPFADFVQAAGSSGDGTFEAHNMVNMAFYVSGEAGSGTLYIDNIRADVGAFVNSLPVVKLGGDKTVRDPDGNGSELVTLDASASYDPDGTIVSYAWTDEAGVELANTAIATIELASGVHQITLTLTDNEGAMAFENLTVTVLAPGETLGGFKVAGTQIIDAYGNPFVMRGVNVAHAWYRPRTHQSLIDIAATGANAVRIVLTTGDQWARVDGNEVADIIKACKNLSMVPILEVHDATGWNEKEGAANPDLMLDYWLSADIREAIDGQEEYVIINIANEPMGNSKTNEWEPWHINAINTLRTAGIQHALMIDAPNWGQDWSSTMASAAQTIFDSDPDKNVIFSVHMYEVYESATTVQNYLQEFVNMNLPLVVGEFADTHGPSAQVAEDAIMQYCEEMGYGYLGWSWSGNGSPLEELDIVEGFSTNLTVWGDKLINGVNGITATSVTASIFEDFNPIPIANAGKNQSLVDFDDDGFELVALDGSLSTDDKEIVSYIWTSGAFSAEGAIATMELPVGTHIVTLTAMDAEGASGTDEVTIVINAPTDRFNAALNKPATASSTDGFAGEAYAAVDGNMSTRWASEWANNQWLMVDLKAVFEIDQVVVEWEGAYAKNYSIEMSEDGTDWTSLFATAEGDGGTDVISLNGTGRFIRLNCEQRGTGWGNSVWEFEAYGTIVNPGGNFAPIADAGDNIRIIDQDEDGFEQVTLDGSNSKDPDGDIVSYLWTNANGEEIANEALATIDLPIGIHEITLTVTDNEGTTSTAKITVTISAPGQPVNGFYVEGKQLLDANGNPFVMKGINVPHAWFASRTEQSLIDIAATGANAVRVVLTTGDRWTRVNGEVVADIIEQCKNNALITILEVHDATGWDEQNGSVNPDLMLDYWLSPDIRAAIEGQEAYVIVNIANEPFGNTKTNEWEGWHANAISTLRNAGIKHSLMIDAPNWGQDWSGTMPPAAEGLFNSDPEQNIIFSVHMYESYGNPNAVQNYLQQFVEMNLPLVVGEFADTHGGSGDVAEQAILEYTDQLGYGFLAWSWSGNGQGLGALDIVENFSTTLTVWGEKLINGTYGIAATAVSATVFEGYNPAPTARAGGNQSVVDLDEDGVELISLDGSGSFDDGAIISYDWSLNGISIASGVSPMVELPVGTHEIMLTVTDDLGATGMDQVTITVNAADGRFNAALNKPALASSTDGFAGDANAAVDGDMSSRWSSEAIDPQWLEVDLIDTFVIDEVNIHWEAAYSRAYDIQMSEDGENWETLYTTYSGTGGVETIAVVGTGRYIRIFCNQRGTQWGNSIWEFEAYGRIFDPSKNEAPTANAGEDFAITDYDNNGYETVSLNGSASEDPDGAIMAYSWTDASGEEIATGISAAIDLEVGTHIIGLTVTDNIGAVSTMDYVSITVLPANGLENIALLKPATASSVDGYAGDGDAAVDGNPGSRWSSEYSDPQWLEVDLEANYNISGVVISWEAAYSSDYQIQVSSDAVNWTTIYVVTNAGGGKENLGLTGSGRYIRLYSTARGTDWGVSIWEFEVYGTLNTGPNQPPVANAGADQSLEANFDTGMASVNLNGAASTDDQGIATYVWTLEGTEIGLGVSPTVGLSVGTHIITLTVTDAQGLTASDDLTVEVTPYLNKAPIAHAGTDQVIMDADDDGIESVLLDGSLSSDAEGIASYEWTLGGTTIAMGVSPIVGLEVGVHVISLTVTDTDGVTASDEVMIEVKPYVNTAPVAHAGADQTIMDADDDGIESVLLDGSLSSDAEGIASYEWTLGGTTIAMGVSPIVELEVGVHVISLTVTDTDGVTASDEVMIEVKPYVNTAPVAHAGADQTIMDTDDDGIESVLLDGSLSSDAEGIASYEWTLGGTTIAMGVSPTVELEVGVHVISLLVTDTDGVTASDEVTITVEQFVENPFNRLEAEDAALSIVSVEADPTASEGKYVYMQGSGSISWTIEASEAGNQMVYMGYRLINGDKSQHLTVNGTYIRGELFSGPIDTWLEKAVEVNLVAGTNTIAFSASWGYMHFDYISLQEGNFRKAANFDASFDYSVYPNPASRQLWIEGADSATLYKIMDVNGTILQEGKGPGVDLTKLGSGIYFINIDNAVTKKIVKQ
ncbi:hypothetical protein PEDI_30200 [Persicobacter diffluens]|uniref:Cellulase n=2 Tax=Persicobacter diffluens TaxID=981 RepID=A0AAN4VZ81_9BACT|nr:hypothetical protein PEDI_30200 [Persicobacter diffluens]